MTQSSPLPRIGGTPRALALAGCLLLVLPQVVVIITSIDPNPAAIFPPSDFSLVWYVNALTRPAFREALAISVGVASVCALVSTAIGTLAALLVVRHRFRGHNALVWPRCELPVLVPEVLLGLGFLILFSRLGRRLSLVNIVLRAHVVITMPFAVRVLIANLRRSARRWKKLAGARSKSGEELPARDVAGHSFRNGVGADLQLRRVLRRFHRHRFSRDRTRELPMRSTRTYRTKRSDDRRHLDDDDRDERPPHPRNDGLLGIERLSERRRRADEPQRHVRLSGVVLS